MTRGVKNVKAQASIWHLQLTAETGGILAELAADTVETWVLNVTKNRTDVMAAETESFVGQNTRLLKIELMSEAAETAET